VHRTESIDYGIVLEGEITLVLDDSEVTLQAGDIVVQRGTDHAWANRTDAVCKVAFILVDGQFERSLLDTLPAGGSPRTRPSSSRATAPSSSSAWATGSRTPSPSTSRTSPIC
jgi:uncharacterized cupin superfamily protein